MAKVVARKETGKLLIDFTYKGVRCREQTALLDTPSNRKRVQAVVDRLTQALKEERFVYGDFFPGSPMVARFAAPSVDPQDMCLVMSQVRDSSCRSCVSSITTFSLGCNGLRPVMQ